MRLKKFEELPYFLENYEVDLINSDVISIAKERSIVHKTQRGHKICRLYRNGTGSVYTLADILAYKTGTLNKDNYFKRIKLKDADDYSIKNMMVLTISEQNKYSGVGKNLVEYWKDRSYDDRDREYEYKYDYLTREKIYKLKNNKKLSNGEISRMLKIPKCTVGRILKDFEPCPKEESRIAEWLDSRLTEMDKKTILKMYETSTQIESICNLYRVPKRIVKRLGTGDLW